MLEEPDPDVTKVHFKRRSAVELSLRAPPARLETTNPKIQQELIETSRLREITNLKIQSELNKTSSGQHLEWQCGSPGCRGGISDRGGMVEQIDDERLKDNRLKMAQSGSTRRGSTRRGAAAVVWSSSSAWQTLTVQIRGQRQKPEPAA